MGKDPRIVWKINEMPNPLGYCQARITSETK